MKNKIRRWAFDLSLAIVGLCIPVITTLEFHQLHERKIREDFRNLTAEHASFINNNIKWHIGILENVGNFFLSSQAVDDREFHTFTKTAFERHGSFDVLGWIELKENSSEFYLEHIEPIDNKTGSRQKINQNSEFNRLLQKSVKDRKTAITIVNIQKTDFRDIHTHKSDEDQNLEHFLFIQPIYKIENGIKTDKLRGIAFSLIDIDYFLKELWIDYEIKFASIELKIINEGASAALFREDERIYEEKFHDSYIIDANQNKFIFDFYPTDSFLESEKTHTTYIFFILTCLLTISFVLIKQMKKHLKEYKQAKIKAEESNRLKSEFLATISHEIRSPMGGILGMAELLLTTDQTFEQKNYTKTIINCGDSLLQVIEDILDFSKIEADRIKLTKEPVDLVELTDDICALYAHKAREKALELAVHYVPGTERFVYADSVRIKQILNNLVNNAIKFTEKGHIVITVSENQKSQDQNYVSLKFSVKDTGIGISKEMQNYIFEKFVQIESSHKRNYPGTGLGLAISQKLAHLMGGKITVESIPGNGSCFEFTLNFQRNANEITKPHNPEILDKLKILVVDDLKIIRTILSEKLSSCGMRCNTAESGEKAFEMIRQAQRINDPYQIILIDYLMPGMNGETLARAINDEPDLRESCLIMLTASGAYPSGNTLFQKGFSAYLSKPVILQNLVKSLAFIWERYSLGETEQLIQIEEKRNSISKEQEKSKPVVKDVNILLAEDSRVNQAFVKEILQSLGCKIDVASNGQDALTMLKEKDFDLVLMDCQMPVMDGFEATMRIRNFEKEHKKNKRTPIIALTANAMEGDRQKCINAGMDDYISKPVRSADLKNSVLSWISDTKIEPQNDNEKPEITNEIDHSEIADNELLDSDIIKKNHAMFRMNYIKILSYFFEDTGQYLSQIKECTKENNFPVMQRLAHTIKSSSRQIGAIKLSEEAKALELKIKNAQAATISLSLDIESLEKTYHLTKNALENVMAQNTTASKS